MSNLNFEKFTTPGRNYDSWCKVKPSNQLLYISSGAVAKLGIREANYVTLHYSKNDNMLGLKLLTEPEDCSLKLIKQGAARAVCLQSFISNTEVEVSWNERFSIKWNDEKGLLIVDLFYRDNE